MLKRILAAGIKTGGALALTTSLAVMTSSKRDTGDAWSAVNAICHIADGDDVSQPGGFRWRESILGLGINALAMTAWGLLYESALLLTKHKSTVVTGAAASTSAYVIDYHIVPDRFKPGIEKRMSVQGVLLAYAVLALTLAATPLWNDYQDRSAQ